MTSPDGGYSSMQVDRPLTSMLRGSGQIASTFPHPKATIRAAGGSEVMTLPFAPSSVQMSGIAPSWTEVSRPGRPSLVLRSNDPLPKLSFDAFLGYADHQQSVEGGLRLLRRLADSKQPLVLSGLGTEEEGYWRLTELSWTSLQRQRGTNAITRATVTFGFTRAEDPPASVVSGAAKTGSGPVAGGVKPAAGSAPKPAAKTYTVARGDTLSSIAINLYRDASKWRAIATANRITDPRKLQVGQRLKLP